MQVQRQYNLLIQQQRCVKFFTLNQTKGRHTAFSDCTTSLTFMENSVDIFSKTTTVTQRRMFGNYFRSLICHSAVTYRQVNLRSLNTEYQERMFGQASNITKQCSNNHPQNVIDNAVLRLQAESSRMMKTLQQQEGEVKKLASTWINPGNTFFSTEDFESNCLLFQSHLERISDYQKDQECGGNKHPQVLSSLMAQQRQQTTARVLHSTIYTTTCSRTISRKK